MNRCFQRIDSFGELTECGGKQNGVASKSADKYLPAFSSNLFTIWNDLIVYIYVIFTCFVYAFVFLCFNTFQEVLSYYLHSIPTLLYQKDFFLGIVRNTYKVND